MTTPLDPATVRTTRTELQRVATHILARRRYAVTGRFGLRAAPDSIATPMFGAQNEVLRLTPTALIIERDGRTHVGPLTSLSRCAELAGVELDPAFSVGHDTPALGDVAAPLAIDPETAARIVDWYAVGASALDLVMQALDDAGPSAVQLWPEHFDVACDVAWGAGDNERVNLGCCAGDDHSPMPYAYAGPWGGVPDPSDGFWNAPFGVLRSIGEFSGERDELPRRVADFMLEAVGRLAG